MTSPVTASSTHTETTWNGFSVRGIQVRLFLTCWLIYCLHFSPFVTRELYLTMALVERQTVHVDDYVILHADLFVIEGRGSFVGSNPGASILAAIPYALSLPVVNKVAPIRTPKAPGEEKAVSGEERYAQRMFYVNARRMGIEVRLGAAAAVTAMLFMAPLAAASVVLMFWLFRRLHFALSTSLWLALLYAFGTPVFFRSATLSLNLLVALLAFTAFVLLWWPSGARPDLERWRTFGAGFLAAYAVVTDFSGAVPAAALGIFALAQQMRAKPFPQALRDSLWYLAGAAGPILFLLWFQWYCYGNPFVPVQYYMPKKYFMNYASERGFGAPQPAALYGLLFDPLYGLLTFSPVFAVALYHFVLLWRRQNRVPVNVAVFTWIYSVAFWVFCSMIHYTLRHQWQDGVRYIVPIVPFLFLLVGDVLARIPRVVAYVIAFAAIIEMWCLAMVRVGPLESIMSVFLVGPELPSVTALSKVAAQYFPDMAGKDLPLMFFLVVAVLVWGIWRVRDPWKPIDPEV